MQVQWYPGHMAKARRAMQEDVKLVDMVVELLDARAPLSSRNPDIDTLANNKLRMVILNKADLADEGTNRLWKNYFSGKGIHTVALDARNSGAKKPVIDAIMLAAQKKFERDRARGIINRPVRIMVAGIPNVGKSTLINSVAGKACTKTGNKPGVTRGNQWIRLNKQVELLDTPGILWPKFEDELVGEHLAFLGSINDEIMELSELSARLIRELGQRAPEALVNRYGITMDEDPYVVMERVAIARAALQKGGSPDSNKAARFILEDFRSGKLGRISLESPDHC
jgi:ribosome biogenesis GTPase A